MVSGQIQELLAHPKLWRAGESGPIGGVDGGKREDSSVATGYGTLDKLLVGGGWPRDGLVELLADQAGIGELRLLTPALAALSRQEQRWVIWINPPHIPYAPALASYGLQIEKMLLVHPKRHEDALWSLEQALKSGTCSAALGWLDERRLTVKDLRRLQLAARQGGTFTVLFRPCSAARQASMAELRLALQPATALPETIGMPDTCRDLLRLEIVKRRGGWPVAPFSLSLQPPLVPLTKTELRAHVEGWRVRARNWQTASAPEPGMPRNCYPLPQGAVPAFAECSSNARHA